MGRCSKKISTDARSRSRRRLRGVAAGAATLALAGVALLALEAAAQYSAPPPSGGGTPWAVEDAKPHRNDSKTNRDEKSGEKPCNAAPEDQDFWKVEDASGAQDPSAPAAAETVPDATTTGQSPIVVEADKLEIEKDGIKVRASGNVDIQWDTTKLRATEVFVDQRERRVEARGGIRFHSDELVATADKVTADVDEETATLEDVQMHLTGEPGRFGGSRLEKTEGRHVTLDDGYFTTCPTTEGHAPDWELRGKHLDVRYDDYARMKNARLEIRGVPLLYLPYVIFPTKQTRQSGLLPFTIGTSTNRGFVFDLPGYWAIDKHQDLTLTGVLETSARVGLDGVYRYAPSRRRWGELHGAFYNEALRGEAKPDSPAVGVPENRGMVELIHREYGQDPALDGGKGWVGFADVQWVGDERFLREVSPLQGDAAERDTQRSRRYTMSRAGGLLSSGFTSGGIDAVYYQDLIGTPITGTTAVKRDTQQKPFNGWLQSDRNVGPVALALDSSVASFVRDKGAGGERLDVASTAALPLLVNGPLQSRAWMNGRGSVYAMNERWVLDDQEQRTEKLGAFPLRGVFQTGVDLRTKLARDYRFEDSEKWSGLYHSLEPFTALRYTNRSSFDEIPLFDRLDAIDGRDVATYGVDSRFLLRRLPLPGKADRGPFELARLSLSQSYNLTREVVDDHFSDIDLAAFVQPVQGFALRTLTSYNVGASQVRGANASLSWETGPLPWLLEGPSSQVAAAYRYVRNDVPSASANCSAGDPTCDVLQSTEMLARLGFTRNFSLGLKAIYDIVGNTFIEKAVGVTFTSSCNCWSIGLGVVERVNPQATYSTGNDGNPDELQVRLAFELTGLGGFGSGVTQRNSPALDSVEYEDVGFWRAGW